MGYRRWQIKWTRRIFGHALEDRFNCKAIIKNWRRTNGSGHYLEVVFSFNDFNILVDRPTECLGARIEGNEIRNRCVCVGANKSH